ncbi:hypothetical protein MRX96_055509 [Rhipicephalus microplus]
MAVEDFIIQFNNPPDAFGGLGPALPPFNGPNEGFIAPAVRPESPFFGLARERYPVIGDTSTLRMFLGRGIGAGNPAGQCQVRVNLCPPDWARIPLPSYEKDCFRDCTVTSQ